ncbi:MAG: glycosyltransferase [Erysipelotrichaceae bacterium]
MKKICICGNFADFKESYDGQTIKTKNLYNELKNKFGKENINVIDTCGWIRKPFKLFLNCLKQTRDVDNLIIIPAHKGVRVFVPIFNALRAIRKYKLHYVVVGGWLPSLIEKNNFMIEELKKLEYIYVENNNTIESLNKLGINNTLQMNNFKNLKKSSYKKEIDKEVFKCCIFSRIEEQKGIMDAIKVVDSINKKNENKQTIKLDIYGQIANDFEKKFFAILFNSKNICYKGLVKQDEIVKTLEKYDLLLFPTKYYTEGIPGTIIDAYFSGLPVLVSRWENHNDILYENETGISYEFDCIEDFEIKLEYLVNNQEMLEKMRENCLKQADKFTAEISLEILYKNIEE